MAARAFARVAPARAKLALVAFVVLALALALRLGDVQVHQGPRLARLALAQHDETVESFARRGAILDREGGVLVRSLPSESIFAVPPDVADPHDAALELAPLLHKPPAALEAALRDKLQFRWLARKVGHDVAERVRGLNLVGIETQARGDRASASSPSGRLASTVVGFTGTDENGLAGLEYALRPAAARQARHDADRDRQLRPLDPLRPDPDRRARRARPHASSPRSTPTCSSRPSG